MTGLSFTGISSGIDTDAIVTSLMAIERRPFDRIQRSADLASARLAGLADMRSRLGVLGDRPLWCLMSPAFRSCWAPGAGFGVGCGLNAGFVFVATRKGVCTTSGS